MKRGFGRLSGMMPDAARDSTASKPDAERESVTSVPESIAESAGEEAAAAAA